MEANGKQNAFPQGATVTAEVRRREGMENVSG